MNPIWIATKAQSAKGKAHRAKRITQTHSAKKNKRRFIFLSYIPIHSCNHAFMQSYIHAIKSYQQKFPQNPIVLDKLDFIRSCDRNLKILTKLHPQ